MRKLTLLMTCVCLTVSLSLFPLHAGRAQTSKVTAKLLHMLTDGQAFVNVWSPDNKTIAVWDKNVALHDAATGKVRAEIKYEGKPGPKSVYLTPDGGALVIHTDRVRFYSTTDGKLLRQFAEGTTPANYHENVYKPEIVSGYDDDGTYKYEVKGPTDGEKMTELPTEYISDRVISPDGKSLLARIKGGAAQVYDVGTGALKFTLEPFVPPGEKKNKSALALGEFSPDSRFVVTSTFGDGTVKVWDTATGKLRHTVGSKEDRQYFAVWNPRNNTFVTKSSRTDQWEINIWSAETGKLIATLDGKAIKEKFDQNLTFVYSPDGHVLLTKAKNNTSLLSALSHALPPKNKPSLIAHL